MTDRDLDARIAVEIFGIRITELRLPSWAEGVIAEGIALPTMDYYVCDEQDNIIQAMYQPGRMSECYVPHYSTDIAAAWFIVEKMRNDGWLFAIEALDCLPSGPWACHLSGPREKFVRMEGGSASRAICLAVLECRG
jgi:hypothetical protein